MEQSAVDDYALSEAGRSALAGLSVTVCSALLVPPEDAMKGKDAFIGCTYADGERVVMSQTHAYAMCRTQSSTVLQLDFFETVT